MEPNAVFSGTVQSLLSNTVIPFAICICRWLSSLVLLPVGRLLSFATGVLATPRHKKMHEGVHEETHDAKVGTSFSFIRRTCEEPNGIFGAARSQDLH